MTHLGNSTGGIKSQVWPSPRPTAFPFYQDGLWEQISPWKLVMWCSFCFSSLKYIMNEIMDWSVALLKIPFFPPQRLLVALKAKFPNQVTIIHMSLIFGFKIQSLWIIDWLKYFWTRFTYLSLRSGAGNSPKDLFPGQGNESHSQLDFKAGQSHT